MNIGCVRDLAERIFARSVLDPQFQDVDTPTVARAAIESAQAFAKEWGVHREKSAKAIEWDPEPDSD